MGRSIALILALLAALPLIWRELRTPDPAPASAPAEAFSAERAMADVRMIARAPHPTGSAANRLVREQLTTRMTELGLSPRVRRDDALFALPGGRLEGGSAESLIGVLPGRDRAAPALAVMAHYDSVPGAPGAGDDAAGAAAALEIVRALKAQGTPVRDVAVILTDGEEPGLLGARGFFARDPLARRIGFVINMEARGSGGRTQMFQTGPENGAAIGLFARTAARPSAGSLFGEVFARMPNDTDFTLAREAGLPGFNYAFLGRSFDYHQPTDSPANLQVGALQDLGDQALAAARAVAFAAELPARRTDAVYGVPPGGEVLAYGPAWGWLPLAVAAALLGLAARRARERNALAWREAARGVAAALFATVGAAAVLHLAGVLAGHGALGAQRLLAQIGRWEAAQLCLAGGFLLFAAAETARGRRRPGAVLALAAGLISCLASGGLDIAGAGLGLAAAVLALLGGGGATSRPAAWAGVLATGLAAATAAQIAAPQAAYVIAWPLLLGAAGAAATTLAADLRPWRLAALGALAALGLAWAGVHAHLIVVATGLPELLALPLFIAALVAWPLAQPAPGAPPERLAGGALLLVGVALVVLLRLADPWDARHPQPSFVAYHLDQQAGRAWRVTPPELRSAWSDAALRAEGAAITRLEHWAWFQPMSAAPARLAKAAAPQIETSRRPDGAVAIEVTPPAGARVLTVVLRPAAPVRLAQVGAASAEAGLTPGGWTRLRWTAPPAEGLTLVLRPAGPGRLDLRYIAEHEGWPQGVPAPPAPPPGVMATGRSGSTFVTGAARVSW